MKKITMLMALLAIFSMNAQITTGEIALSSGYTAQIDVDDTTVTLTLIGPDDVWLGLGLGVSSMTAGNDIVSFDGSGFNDREFMGIGVPPATDTQDWTMVSNDTAGGERTVVATRALSGSDANDYTFSTSDTTILLVWARGNGTLSFSNHGQGNRGDTDSGFALGILDNELQEEISVYPNPSPDQVNIAFDNRGEEVNLQVFATTGQLVAEKTYTGENIALDVSQLPSGIYIARVATANGIATRRIIKQ